MSEYSHLTLEGRAARMAAEKAQETARLTAETAYVILEEVANFILKFDSPECEGVLEGDLQEFKRANGRKLAVAVQALEKAREESGDDDYLCELEVVTQRKEGRSPLRLYRCYRSFLMDKGDPDIRDCLPDGAVNGFRVHFLEDMDYRVWQKKRTA